MIFSVGYRNRFGHPKQDVLERYVQSGARLHRTDAHGAIGITIDGNGVVFRHERELRRRYWHSQPTL